MAKTYFLARMKDGRCVIRASKEDYGYTWAYPNPDWPNKVSFSRYRPTAISADAVPVEKIDGKTARLMLRDGTAKGSV